MAIDDYVSLPFIEAQQLRLDDARAYIKKGEFYEALDTMKKISTLAAVVDSSTPPDFRQVTLELYRLGIEVRMKEAQDALQEGNLEDAQEKLGLVEHYARGLKMQPPLASAQLKRKLFNASVQAALKKQSR